MFNKVAKIDTGAIPVQARAQAGPATVGFEFDVETNAFVVTIDNTPTRVSIPVANGTTGALVRSSTRTDASISTASYQNQFTTTLTPATTFDAGAVGFASVRGELILSAGKGIIDGFISAVSARFTATTGTIDQTSASRVQALFAKADFGTLAISDGQQSSAWIDMAGTPTGSLAELNVLRVTNSGGAIVNAMVYFHGKATHLFDINEPSASFIATAGTGAQSAGVSTGGVAAQVLKVLVGGSIRYIPLFSSNA